jgi:hypothetical protein
MKMKILLLLSLLIITLGGIGAGMSYAEDANTPADPNEVNDPNLVVPE